MGHKQPSIVHVKYQTTDIEGGVGSLWSSFCSKQESLHLSKYHKLLTQH